MLESILVHPPQNLEPGHARLGPSSASRWLACPASVRLGEIAGPRPAGNAAQVGTVIHAAMEEVLRGKRKGLTEADRMEIEALDYSVATAEMILERAIISVRALVERFEIAELWLEQRVWPLEGREDLWGTSDIIGISACGSVLVVADLKTGRGRVDPKFNDQALLYGLGARRAVGERGSGVERVAVAIIQPVTTRAGFSVWETDTGVLREFEGFVRETLAKVDDPADQPVAGQWCQYCPAKTICPAR